MSQDAETLYNDFNGGEISGESIEVGLALQFQCFKMFQVDVRRGDPARREEMGTSLVKQKRQRTSNAETGPMAALRVEVVCRSLTETMGL